MIYLLSDKKKFNLKTEKELEKHKLKLVVLDPKKEESIAKIILATTKELQILICPIEHPLLGGTQLWQNILKVLSFHSHIIFTDPPKEKIIDFPSYFCEQEPKKIISMILELNRNDEKAPTVAKPNFFSIPYLNTHILTEKIKRYGSLSLITIQTPQFQDVAINYGEKAYEALSKLFKKILYNMWGSTGNFRKSDILCSAKYQKDTYYILLEPSRDEKPIPSPGDISKLTKRLKTNITAQLWKELNAPRKEKIVPELSSFAPRFDIGYATSIYNKHLSPRDILALLLEDLEKSKIEERNKNLRTDKELLQYFIKNENLLIPNYQGVFEVKNITKEMINNIAKNQSIKSIQNEIYGFEALIRVNVGEAQKELKPLCFNFLDFTVLRPDILFLLAEQLNLTLELDQECLKKSIQYFSKLPGILFANVLPRNFNILQKSISDIPKKLQMIFEISESEVIHNQNLMQEIRTHLSQNGYSLAIDDFGAGFAGIHRVLSIKPDIIKLDRNLIIDIDKSQIKQDILSGIIKAGCQIGSILLAEGVETIEEFMYLKENGVQLVQGYLLHKPQKASDIVKDIS